MWQATIPMGRRWRVESILAPDAPLRRLPLAAEDFETVCLGRPAMGSLRLFARFRAVYFS